MQSIGDFLKQAREKRGMSLQEIFDATRITVQNLSALEENRFDFFPNKVYARAFLRDYSNFLGLDSSDLLLRYEEEWKQDVQAQVAERPAQPKGCRSKLAMLLIALVVVAAAIGGYYLWSEYEAEQAFPGYESFRIQPTPTPTPTPTQTPTVTPMPTPSVTPGVSPAPAGPVVTPAPSQSYPLPSPTEAPDTGVILVPTPTPAPTPVVKPTPAPVKGVEVSLKGRTPVWVRVVADGKRLYEATMPASKTMTWSGDKSVTVRIAKPGDVTLKFNGKPVKLTGNPVIPVTREFRPETP